MCLKQLVHLTTVNAIIIPVDKGKYKKINNTELDFNTENMWASNFVSIISCIFMVKNKITDKA